LARILLLFVFLGFAGWSLFAEDDPAKMLERVPLAKNEIERDHAWKRGFEAALAGDPDVARRYLPAVIDKPWLGEMNFREACALAQSIEEEEADGGSRERDARLAEKLVLAAGLQNPALALRESEEYLGLGGGRRLFERFVLAAPDEAVAMAAGTDRSALAFRERLARSGSAELALLARIAEDGSIDLPWRSHVAVFAGRIARDELSFQSALRIAGDTRQFFGAVLDLRVAGAGADTAALDRALENESLVLCRAAQESAQRTLARDLAGFRTRDLYALLALGRAEATPEVFGAVFDRLLLPKWKAETPKGRSLLGLLDQTKNWELRDFAAGALAARRFDALLSIAGRELVSRLTRGIDRSRDPLKEGMRMAEIVDATRSPELLKEMASIISEEFARCREANDLRGTTIYGLLAGKLSVDPIAAPYLPFFQSSETLDTALLFGKENDCVQRHFFYDDDDGVKSFESFRRSYERDPAWTIEDRGQYVHLAGRGPEGRRIEIYANVPIDAHLPENRAFEGEAQRRQQAITRELRERGLVATVIVHRGHSFWEEKTRSYLEKTARLVILGDCGGVTQIHAVLEASHDAQVIATRGIGTTEINDAILKAVNDRILNGERIIRWSAFWRELSSRWGHSALFRDYVAPNQDAGTVFLRSYYRFLDALN
jgi:predicted lipid carrier protein YhbT